VAGVESFALVNYLTLICSRSGYRLIAAPSGRKILMAAMAISIDLPPVGELETSGNGSSPTDAQMAEEEKVRQKFLDAVSPFLASVPKRRPSGMSAGRSGLPDRAE